MTNDRCKTCRTWGFGGVLLAASVLPIVACGDEVPGGENSSEVPAPSPAPAPESGAPGGRAEDDEAVTAKGVPVTIDVLANDGLTGAAVTHTSAPEHGAAVVKDGRIVYTPAADYSGEDAFEYVAQAQGGERTGLVKVTVLGEPGTVAAGTLFTAEVDDEVSWADISAGGDRVGRLEKASTPTIVIVDKAGARTTIEPPGPAEDVLVRGLADDGTVLAQYLHASRFQFIGFTWKNGVADRVCDLGDGAGDCTLERMNAKGVIVGTAYDYTTYNAFVWAPGADRNPISLPGYENSYGYAINDDGIVVGDGDGSDDGYTGPQRCFKGQVGVGDTGVTGVAVQPFQDGDPHFVFCRGINAAGVIVGAVKPLADEAGRPRSETDRIKAAIWHPTAGFAYVRFPFPRPSASSWRLEQLYGINASGIIVGTFQDVTPEPPGAGGEPRDPKRVTRGITLTPVTPRPNTSFEDSTFDHVDGPI